MSKQTRVVTTKVRVKDEGDMCHPQCQYLVVFEKTNNCGLFWVRLSDGVISNIRRCDACKKAEVKA
jgi:type IV pilus biogenesis protein CpaD/CtpE